MAEATVPSPTKPCSLCQETKPRDAFTPGHNQCRACLAAKAKARYWQNPAQERINSKNWRRKNSEKCRAMRRKWDRENPEKRRASCRKWNHNNPDKINANSRKWRHNNPDKVRAKSKQWHHANPDKVRAGIKQWQRANPDKVRANKQKRRARLANAVMNDFTAAQWREMLDAYGHRCVYCGRKMQRLEQDHIIPLSKGGNHTKANIVPACRSCNSKKGTGAPLVPVQPLLL